MYIMIASIIFAITLLFINDSLKVYRFKKLEDLFDQHLVKLLECYLKQKATYDMMIQNSGYDPSAYTELLNKISTFIDRNIPILLKKSLKSYYGKDQYYQKIILYVDFEMSKVYINS